MIYMINPAKNHHFLKELILHYSSGCFLNFSILKTKISLSNMYVVDQNGYPHKFESTEDILKVFCARRMFYYEKRYNKILLNIQNDIKRAQNRYKFIKGIVDEKLKINVTDEKLYDLLSGEEWAFDEMRNTSSPESSSLLSGYAYLLDISIRSMTATKLAELKREYESSEIKLQEHKTKTPRSLWMDDLSALRSAYKIFLNTRDEEPVKTKLKSDLANSSDPSSSKPKNPKTRRTIKKDAVEPQNPKKSVKSVGVRSRAVKKNV